MAANEVVKNIVLVTHILGIIEMLLSWISSFLTERNPRVREGSIFAEICDVLSGVPLSSVLGPLLFLRYIDSIVYHSSNSDKVLFCRRC